jgi:translation initiation factor IF-1
MLPRVKEDTTIEFDGTVQALAPNGFYRVLLDDGHHLLARRNSKMTITLVLGIR